jgi:hypothetical protein
MACSCENDEDANFCRSCGQKLRRSEKIILQKIPVAATVGNGFLLGEDGQGEESIIAMEENSYVSSDADPLTHNPVPRATRHESFIAKLDRMEQEFETRVDTQTETPPPEADESQEKLESLSSTLDSLIADLLEVEINEYSYPDFIHPDESGFPSRDPASYAERAPDPHKKRSAKELLLIAALITAIFLVGLSFGLWGAYFLGI